jgi:hypothetical protein
VKTSRFMPILVLLLAIVFASSCGVEPGTSGTTAPGKAATTTISSSVSGTLASAVEWTGHFGSDPANPAHIT